MDIKADQPNQPTQPNQNRDISDIPFFLRYPEFMNDVEYLTSLHDKCIYIGALKLLEQLCKDYSIPVSSAITLKKIYFDGDNLTFPSLYPDQSHEYIRHLSTNLNQNIEKMDHHFNNVLCMNPIPSQIQEPNRSLDYPHIILQEPPTKFKLI